MTQAITPYPFRVFLSYAHADRALVEQMADILKRMGLQPLWDVDINPGKAFTNEIKELISRSHLFIPVLTPHSSTRPWIHQETGFAIALNIPVLPISIGQTPSEMMAEIQAVTVYDDLSDLAERLEKIDLMQLVTPKPSKPFGTVEIAEWPEQRNEYLIRYANWVTELGEYGLIRLQARYTTFAVPDADLDESIWAEREGNTKRTRYFRNLQREERRSLERHARIAGCKMIIDPAAGTLSEQGPKAQQARLSVLLDFIKDMPSDKLAIVISKKAQDSSLTIVGDYFAAEAVAYRSTGYVHTVFNSHPPTVLQRIQRFDQLFNEIQLQNPMTLDKVIETIECILAKES